MPRSRARKARLTRMDAAVDAMVPFGFPEEKVRKHVKELLKVKHDIDQSMGLKGYSSLELESNLFSETNMKFRNMLRCKIRKTIEVYMLFQLNHSFMAFPSTLTLAKDSSVYMDSEIDELLMCIEYGGDEGWPFIEECSYKELIDAILRDDEENDQEKVAEDGHQGKEKSSGDEIAAGTSSSVPNSQQDERPQETTPADIVGSSCAVAERSLPEITSSSSGINAGWKDILPYQQSEHVEATANISSKNGKNLVIEENPPSKTPIPASPSLINIISPPPTNSLPTRRRPCYGWIESDEEDIDDFIYLRPAPVEVRAKATHLPQAPSTCPSDATKSERKRRSRWDERP
ncbi:UNVERIFIED_CONTAM: hypothetical protein Sangu_2123400 [Sesamum angustifolium]|uniref:WIYLD domain-containing protein n=1 Tax=Sesamum angustifolium TaxID=2727405 RepID=A0AAW2LFX5_9LAMI